MESHIGPLVDEEKDQSCDPPQDVAQESRDVFGQAGSAVGWHLDFSLVLLQSRILRLGLLQDGDVGVGVFPEGEKVLISLPALSCVAGERMGSGQTDIG